MLMSTHVPTPPPLYSRSREVLLMLLAVATGLGAGTQYMAYRVGFHPALGAGFVDMSTWPYWTVVALGLGLLTAISLFSALLGRWTFLGRWTGVWVIGLGWALALGQGPLYSPADAARWAALFTADSVLTGLFQEGLVAAFVGFIGTFLVTLPLRAAAFPLRETGSQGTAAWGEGRSLQQTEGLLLGMRGRTRLRYDGDGHLLTLAPTGAGKGVGPIMTNLLSYPGSVVVTDPKGENYAVTRRWREEGLGHEVVAFDPFGVVEGRGTFNPLDLIDTSRPEAMDDARSLAEMMVVERGRVTENDAHFADEGKELIAGFILFAAHTETGPARSLARVRELITLPPEPFDELLQRMLGMSSCNGLIARTAARLLQKADRERSGVVSSAQRHTHWLDSFRVARSVRRSNVDLMALKRRRVSIYLVLPMDRIDAYAPWLRLMIGSCILAVIRDARARPERRVLFLLDEFPNIGPMESIARAVALLRGYGATIWMFAQNLAQLKSVYPDRWETYLDVDVLQAFGTNDQFTAEHISKVAGDRTVFAGGQNTSKSSGRKRGRGWQRSFSFSERARRLVTPDEVRRLPENRQILFVKGEHPVLAERLRYFRDPVFRRRAMPNPYYLQEDIKK